MRAGEVVGLGGLVGSRHTEVLRLIYGLDPLDSGEVVLAGKRLRAGHPRAAIRQGLGLAPEDRKSQALILDWSEAKNVTIADLGRFSRLLLDVRRERETAREQLRALNTVPDDPDRAVRLLSGGNQQKVVLARWLLRRCRVLLLDEPTRGVDVATKAEIYRIIPRPRELRAGRARRLLGARGLAASAPVSWSCAKARSSRRSTARTPPSTRCFGTQSRQPTHRIVEEVV